MQNINRRFGYTSKKPGFTLVELIVVVAIIGILIAILLPAVQMVRESARRTSCANKMKQLSLSILNFESAHRVLPSGVNSKSVKHGSMSWQTQVMPFLEQSALWEQAIRDYQLGGSSIKTHSGLSTPVEVVLCPSDPHSPGRHWTHDNLLVASTDYLGVNGINHLGKDGVFFVDSKTRLRAVTDGLSNTLFLGERPPSSDYWYGWWYAGEGFNGTGAPDMVLGVNEINGENANGRPTHLEDCPAGPFQFSKGKWDQCDTLHFWSYHPGGANFSFGDGRVEFISYSLSNEVMTALSTRNRTEVVSGDY